MVDHGDAVMPPPTPPFQYGTRYKVRLSAGTFEVPGKGEFNDSFAAGAFDGQVGHVVGMTVNGEWAADVRIVAADVAEDGCSVEITYEVLPA